MPLASFLGPHQGGWGGVWGGAVWGGAVWGGAVWGGQVLECVLLAKSHHLHQHCLSLY